MYDVVLFWNGNHFSPVTVDQPTALTLLNLRHSIERPFYQSKSKKAVILACLCMKISTPVCNSEQTVSIVEAEITATDSVLSSTTATLNMDTASRGG